jgi:hypothetical protein
MWKELLDCEVDGVDQFTTVAGASDEAIAAIEARLAVKLPSSYCAFLKQSNGCKIRQGLPALLSVESIKPFSLEHSEWVEMYQMPDLEYDAAQLKQAIQISSARDGRVFLLIPALPSNAGECQAWDFSDHNPGAYCYDSFEALMRDVRAELEDV